MIDTKRNGIKKYKEEEYGLQKKEKFDMEGRILSFCCGTAGFWRDLCGDPHRGLIQKQDSVQLLNKGWYYIKDGKKQEITLPAEIPAKTGEKLILYNEVWERKAEE